MLLSMLLSFLLARRFHRKTYVVLFSAVIVALISFLSTGVPHYETHPYPPELLGPENTSGVVPSQPLPLSIPFYAIIDRPSYQNPLLPRERTVWEYYQIDLLTFQFLPYPILIDAYVSREAEQLSKVLYMDWGEYWSCYLFFFALNLVGAIIGCLISRTTCVDQRLRKVSRLRLFRLGRTSMHTHCRSYIK